MKIIQEYLELKLDNEETLSYCRQFLWSVKKTPVPAEEYNYSKDMKLVFKNKKYCNLEVRPVIGQSFLMRIFTGFSKEVGASIGYLMEDLYDQGLSFRIRDQKGNIIKDLEYLDEFDDEDDESYDNFFEKRRAPAQEKKIDNPSLAESKISELREAIDDALDKKDKGLFLSLSRELKELEKSSPS